MSIGTISRPVIESEIDRSVTVRRYAPQVIGSFARTEGSNVGIRNPSQLSQHEQASRAISSLSATVLACKDVRFSGIPFEDKIMRCMDGKGHLVRVPESPTRTMSRSRRTKLDAQW